MKRHLTAAAAAFLTAAAMANGPLQADPAGEDETITLRGCVVKGEGGYVLLPFTDAGTEASTPAPAGTSGVQDPEPAPPTGAPAGTMRVLYWLDDDDAVDDHAGQRVEIVGELEDDIDRGEISIEREEDGLVEVEFKREGKTISVKLPSVPASVATSGSVSDTERDYEYAVRTVDVKSVRMLASACR